jgi:hypothetical protein
VEKNIKRDVKNIQSINQFQIVNLKLFNFQNMLNGLLGIGQLMQSLIELSILTVHCTQKGSTTLYERSPLMAASRKTCEFRFKVLPKSNMSHIYFLQ